MGRQHVQGHSGKNILFAFSLNAAFAVIELIGGYFTNSVAIISDALHDLGDSLALLVSYFAEKVSLRNPDHKYTFGYKRFSLLSALLNGFILIFGSIFVIKEAVERISSPEPVNPQGMVLIALLGLIVNGIAARRLSKEKGFNAKMLMYHLMEDLLGWCAVLVVSIVLLFKPWYVLDSVLSILIALVVLRGVFKNLVKIGGIFVQRFPDEIDMDRIVEDIEKLDEVKDVHLLRGWSLDQSTINLTLHIRVAPELRMMEADRVRMEAETLLKKAGASLWTIQVESSGH